MSNPTPRRVTAALRDLIGEERYVDLREDARGRGKANVSAVVTEMRDTNPVLIDLLAERIDADVDE